MQQQWIAAPFGEWQYYTIVTQSVTQSLSQAFDQQDILDLFDIRQVGCKLLNGDGLLECQRVLLRTCLPQQTQTKQRKRMRRTEHEGDRHGDYLNHQYHHEVIVISKGFLQYLTVRTGQIIRICYSSFSLIYHNIRAAPCILKRFRNKDQLHVCARLKHTLPTVRTHLVTTDPYTCVMRTPAWCVHVLHWWSVRANSPWCSLVDTLQ